MSDGFNPYREWLCLGTSSPNYYELLGLSLHELDAAKIAAAAERALTRVRGFRPGPQAREWSRLLDEIRAAKECLLDADCRTRYDAERASDAAANPILPPESPFEAESVSENSTSLEPSDLPEAIVFEPAVPTATQTWSSGPSPLYGFADRVAVGSESNVPAVTAPVEAQKIAPSIVMPRQPVLPAAYGSPQRATFRAAHTTPENIARPRGRGVVWGFILLLWLVVGGLTYRLSIVARQQKAAEDAASEVEAKQGARRPHTKPPAGAQTKASDTPATN